MSRGSRAVGINVDHAVEHQETRDPQPSEVGEQNRKLEQRTSSKAASVASPLIRSTGDRLPASRNPCQSQDPLHIPAVSVRNRDRRRAADVQADQDAVVSELARQQGLRR